ncbi:MAG: LTA synthase family protein, partial [Alistipes sp.]|nr:LTA synthase family protein [Alistipes sp.]
MRRNLSFIVLLFSVTLALSALQKPLFWVWYSQLFSDASISDFFDVIWHGLPLDATFAGYVTAIPILIVLIASWLPHRIWQGIIKWYLVAISLFTAACVSLNLGLYEHWGYPLDSSIFQFLATPKQAMASVTLWQAIEHTLLAVVWFCLTCYCYMAVLRL